MTARLLQLTRDLLLLAAVVLALFAIQTGPLALQQWTVALTVLLLSLLFLQTGPLIGVCGLLAAGGLLEAISTLPSGRMMFASACAGLILLHLANRQEWSTIGRGLVMCATAGTIWQGLIEFFLFSQSGFQGVWQTAGIASLTQGAAAVLLWQAGSVLLLGSRTVWRESATRPVRFGREFR